MSKELSIDLNREIINCNENVEFYQKYEDLTHLYNLDADKKIHEYYRNLLNEKNKSMLNLESTINHDLNETFFTQSENIKKLENEILKYKNDIDKQKR